MKIRYIIVCIAVLGLLGLQSCSNDEGSFGDGIFNSDTKFPYVSIQDRNEDLDSIVGNNFWSYELVSENGGDQVRIAYATQDDNIVSHDIIVGFDGVANPPEDGVVLRTLTTFPTEIIITKQEIATALNVPVESLQTGSVFFGGKSVDADDHIVDDPNDFELFLFFERHAYFYEWILDQ